MYVYRIARTRTSELEYAPPALSNDELIVKRGRFERRVRVSDLPNVAGDMTLEDVRLNGNQLEGPVDFQHNAIDNYAVTVSSGSIVGNHVVNLLDGVLQIFTVSASAQVTFSNPPSAGLAVSVTLFLTSSGTGHNLTFPGVLWDGGLPPNFSTAINGAEMNLSFIVIGGGQIRGYVAAENMS